MFQRFNLISRSCLLNNNNLLKQSSIMFATSSSSCISSQLSLTNASNHVNHNLLSLNKRSIHLSCNPIYMPIKTTSPYDYNDDWFSKIWRMLGRPGIPEHRLSLATIYIYEACTDDVNVETFFKFCQLPDTFLSWFLITELHVWMCMVRGMSEGKEGRINRNELVQRMWEDTELRLKKLGTMSSKVKREGLKDLSSLFQAALFSYDEGLLTDDKTLAAALWRCFFGCQQDLDAVVLETLVAYVRTQVDHLTSIDREHFLVDGRIQWKPFAPFYP